MKFFLLVGLLLVSIQCPIQEDYSDILEAVVLDEETQKWVIRISGREINDTTSLPHDVEIKVFLWGVKITKNNKEYLILVGEKVLEDLLEEEV